MSAPIRPARPAFSILLVRAVAAAVAALALAIAPAAASPTPRPALPEICEGLSVPDCERQVLAARSLGAPTGQLSQPPAAPAHDNRSGWAAALAGLASVALVAGLVAVKSRRRRPRMIA